MAIAGKGVKGKEALGVFLNFERGLSFLGLSFLEAGTKVGPDQLGLPFRVGSTRIDSDRLGS